MLTHVRRLAVLALLALAAGARPAFAQAAEAAALANGPANAPVAADTRAAANGPTLDAARVAARPIASTEAGKSHAALPAQGLGQGAALMIVGFGALLVGAIIGGDAGTIFMVGGAVVGLAGLYQYLK